MRCYRIAGEQTKSDSTVRITDRHGEKRLTTLKFGEFYIVCACTVQNVRLVVVALRFVVGRNTGPRSARTFFYRTRPYTVRGRVPCTTRIVMYSVESFSNFCTVRDRTGHCTQIYAALTTLDQFSLPRSNPSDSKYYFHQGGSLFRPRDVSRRQPWLRRALVRTMYKPMALSRTRTTNMPTHVLSLTHSLSLSAHTHTHSHGYGPCTYFGRVTLTSFRMVSFSFVFHCVVDRIGTH